MAVLGSDNLSHSTTFKFNINSAERVRLAPDGSVIFFGPSNNSGGGITTNNEGSTFEKLVIRGDRGNGGIIFENNSGEAMRLNTAGNFGIGASIPDALLTLKRNLTDGQRLINFDAHRGFDLRRIGGTDASAGLFFNMRTVGNGMGFAFGGTITAYFDTNGRLGLGTGQGTPGYRLQLPNAASNAGGRGLANAWHTYSDDRVKINEEQIPYGLSTVMQLNPLKYLHLNSSKNEDDNIVIHEEGEESIGLIAQEVAELIPEIVSIPEDPEKELYALDYEKLTAVLIKAIQDQQEIINNLTTRIESLENN
jgi:hypothetical protein